MTRVTGLIRALPALSGMTLWACTASGCGSWEQNVALYAGATVLGAHSPNNEIEQIYYLGVFDPQEQVPPTVYRIRVHGQASFISNTRFASGWVPAPLVDSLSSDIRFSDKGKVSIDPAGSSDLASLSTGRRLMLFGPEGFREAPTDHRLVILMGSSPEDFFRAIDEVTGAVSGAAVQQQNDAVRQLIIQMLAQTRTDRERLDSLEKKIESLGAAASQTGGTS